MKSTQLLRRLVSPVPAPASAWQRGNKRTSPQIYPLLFGGHCVATQGISSDCELKCALAEVIPSLQDRLKSIKAAFGGKSLGEVTVNMSWEG